MSQRFIHGPTVEIVGKMKFFSPESIPYCPSSNDANSIVELAGKNCYNSFGNWSDSGKSQDGHRYVTGRKSQKDYIGNLIGSKHNSVLEHSAVSMLISGVSRALLAQITRHRAGVSFSVLSQRYVDESEVSFVVPPAILKSPSEEILSAFMSSCNNALEDYKDVLKSLRSRGLPRKKAFEAARYVLPSATATRFVMTANGSSWRHFLSLRDSDYADEEISRLARVIRKRLCDEVSEEIYGV